MTSVPQIFDRKLYRRRRARVARRFFDYDFLAARAADELAERIAERNERFPTTVCSGFAVPLVEQLDRLVTFDSVAPARGDVSVIGDEERLPFRDGSIDLYSSVMTLHALNDLPGALAQIRRALRPNGVFLCALFGGETLTELRQAFTAAEIERDGGLSPRVFPFADVRDMGSLLQRAGFAEPVVDSDTVTVHYEHPRKLLRDLRGMGETNVLAERRRRFLRRGTLERMYEIYGEKFSDADGRVRATFQILYLTGRARFEAQQQPMDDGNRMRLG